MYLSTNSGANWTRISTGLPNLFDLIFPTIEELVTVPNGSGGTNIFAGTFLFGVWRRPLTEITDVRLTSSTIPDEFSLEQNYPNPFNPTTTIAFDVPSRSLVSLTINDALGREVAVLVSDELAPGRYAHQWNAEGRASGVYFYRLSVVPLARRDLVPTNGRDGQAGGYVATKKLVLLR
jgi:hypothetical protein